MTKKHFSRRSFIASTAQATGGVITLGVLSRTGALDAQEAPPYEHEWQHLDAHQGRTVDALTRMIMPSDDNGPGAAEARVVVYIDRALGAHRAEYRATYESGVAAFDQYCLNAHEAPFLDLDGRTQRRALMGMDRPRSPGTWPEDAPMGARDFLRMVVTHTMEGMFSDPSYGGNYRETGWKLIRFPGRAPFGYDPPFSEFDMTIPETEYPEWKPYDGPMKSRIIGEE
ncbi:MAG: gluconate 2-dehydrogenase subunit 3 family protein [Gemmatimonadota bacterium]|nr:gluconate 2-dehydrogenase subunit 3 family protein [Gemmatimonadota bacterium]